MQITIHDCDTAQQAAEWCVSNIGSRFEMFLRDWPQQSKYIFSFADEQDFVLFSLNWA
jgi:hypothetical protein